MHNSKTQQDLFDSPSRGAFINYLNQAYPGKFDFTALESERPYFIWDALELSPHFYSSIRDFAANAWRSLMDVTRLTCALSERELVALGFPDDFYPQVLGMQEIPPCEMALEIAVQHADFENGHFTQKSFKIMSVNTRPDYQWELFEGNRLAAHFLNVDSPNAGMLMAQTGDLRAYVESQSTASNKPLVFSLPYWGDNDLMALGMDMRLGDYQQAVGQEMGKFSFLEDFIFNTDGVFMSTGEQVYNLFLHVNAYDMSCDQGVDRNNSIDEASPWQILTENVIEKKVNRFPPISSDILGSGITTAFAYQYAKEKWFSNRSEEIETLFLPTFLQLPSVGEMDELPAFAYGAPQRRFVNGELLYETAETTEDMPLVYRQHVNLPSIWFSEGFKVDLVFTVMISALGRPTAVGCRAYQPGNTVPYMYPLGVA